MICNKHISKIILAVTAVAVVLCLLAVAFSGALSTLLGGTDVQMEYEGKLFDTDEVISVNIEMDEDTWNEMLENAMSEEYYVCNVVINGTRINNVAIRPKGNTSLSAIAMDPETDRYSLKLEFDHFVEGQTCFGLDKLILNNNYADATNMKEAIVYDMYQYLGADASLYNYAKVSVNGEYWGVYLALEGVEQSFMLRNFGTQDGELYKPDTMEMGGGASSGEGAPNMERPDADGFDFSNFDVSSFEGKTPPSGEDGFSSGGGEMPSFEGFSPENMPNQNEMPSFEGFSPEDMPNADEAGASDAESGDEAPQEGTMPDRGEGAPSGFGGGSRSGGANLNYIDDELDSYSTIWDAEVTKTGKKDHRRVVTALKNISEGTELETYLDVDNVLKYMAVHTFSVNMDSLSGSMAHNYYLYEYDGQLNIFPWDYNLAFGGMSMGKDADATSTVNDAIDTPFDGTQFFDALLENEEYLARYHAYLQQLVDEYVNGGRFDEVYSRIRSQIDSLVETDPTAFYSYEEYETAAELLHETVLLRAKSIDGQLAGTIPSTDAGQQADSSALIDASHINVKEMGQFNMGGSRSDRTEDDTEKQKTDMPDNLSEGFDKGSMPSGFGGGNFSPENLPRQSSSGSNLVLFAVCFGGMLLALLVVRLVKRKRG